MTTQMALREAMFQQLALIAKAVASPKRLELLELLIQSPKSVEDLALQSRVSVKLASAHLKALRHARMVETERQGKRVIYRISSAEIPSLCMQLRRLAEARLHEMQEAVRQFSDQQDEWQGASHAVLLQKARAGEIIVIDVRVTEEYAYQHIPFARSIPFTELRAQLATLPKDIPIVAYCRGPFCMMSSTAAQILRAQGFEASHFKAGIAEWQGGALDKGRADES